MSLIDDARDAAEHLAEEAAGLLAELAPDAHHAPPANPPVPPPVHLEPAKGRRAWADFRAFPLGEFSGATLGTAEGILRVIDFLDVEHSARYAQRRDPAGKILSTYCNIYAYDACHELGVYLPHVYWTERALSAFARGEHPPVRYDDTVTELSANGLFAWLERRGPLYGWRRTQEAAEVQEAADQGRVAVCCARSKPGGIGHVALVAPASPAKQPLRDRAGRVVAPVLSQAGARNLRLYSAPWYAGAWVGGWGFWIAVG